MSFFLGIDTSNYTTSVSAFDSETNKVYLSRKLLPVKEGSLGLRQSDAVFHHTSRVFEIFSSLYDQVKIPRDEIALISSSISPRRREGSYMPCFLVGKAVGDVLSLALDAPKEYFSHQEGHIASALFKASEDGGFYFCKDRLRLLESDLIAFHFSGGTSDCLLVRNKKGEAMEISEICSSLDLKAGQAVDRVGAMLGLGFPAGKELEALARLSDKSYCPRPYSKNGSVSFSGLENKCQKMLSDGESKPNIARFALDYIASSAQIMLDFARKSYGDLPVILSGGVMSNQLIKNKLFLDNKNIIACETALSSDNSCGVALLGYLKLKGFV